MKALGAWLLAGAAGFAGLANALASTDTITWGGDNSRTGYQTNHNMDPSVVGSNQFGQIFKVLLPGNYGGATEQIFSQPLVYTPNNGTTQYVYWATTQNNLYKMNAKTGEIVARRNLHIPFLTADLNGCVDINPNIGVTATGVIDPDTETLYLTAKTYIDQTQLNTAQGRPAGRYYAHAIDVNDLSERPNFPINLENLNATNNPDRIFTAGIHHQRPGLLHVGDYVYAGFASHCVQYDFSGWIIGWHKTTGKIVESWAAEGANVPITTKGGGIWMSGGGLASDDAGSVFFATGNGYASQLSTIPVQGFQPPTAQEESAVHMTLQSDGSLKIIDFFMPWEKQALDGADKDLGCSPLELLPPEFACGDIKRVGVITGKSGKTYWLNMDNLGGYRNGPDNRDAVIQVFQNDNSVYAGAGVYPLEGGYIYINVIQHPSNVFQYSCVNGSLSFPKVATTAETNAYILGVSHGTTTSLNGQPGTGLFWVTDVQGLGLRIYDAVPKDGTMNMINSFSIPGVNKFTRPVFGDGLVYIGTNQGYVYAYGSPVNSPLNCTSPTDFGNADIKSTSANRTVTCTANIAVTVSGIELSNPTDFSIGSSPAVPLNVAKGSTFSVTANFSPSKVGLLSSDILVNTTNSVAGYSIQSHARLVGTGQSIAPLLDVAPNTVTFDAVVAGEDPDGVSQQFLVNNLGNSKLTIQKVLYSANNATGPTSTWTGPGDLVVGRFRVQNIPTTLDGHSTSSVNVIFNSTQSGTYSGFLTFVSDGGTKSLSLAASAGPAAKAVFEFQTPDGNGWVPYVSGQPFTFGNVTENSALPLKFRITNGAPAGGVKLSLTVSKPPFGVDGLITAANQVDLAEGTSLAPGESGTAVLTCSAPKTQWNVDSTNGTAQWTINTNDPVMGKQFVQFACTAVAPQAPPLQPNGQGLYRYKGCFLENNPGRQLQKQLYSNSNNTNPMCIAACAAGNYLYCGTQYHSECWAGNSIPVKQVDDLNCNYDCSGDLNQICGGNGNGTASYISLFVNSNGTETGPVSGPGVNPGVNGYGSIGCYTEATSGRALPNGVTTTAKTVANCVSACKASSYTYAGLEYGGECWCGNAFAAGSVPAPISDCNMVCNGNSTEFCGGPSRLNVYQLGAGGNNTTTTTPTPAPTPTFSNRPSDTASTAMPPGGNNTTTTSPTPVPTPVPTITFSIGSSGTASTAMTPGGNNTTTTSPTPVPTPVPTITFSIGSSGTASTAMTPGGNGTATASPVTTANPTTTTTALTTTSPTTTTATTTTPTTTTTTKTTITTPTPTPTGPARKAVVDTVWKLQGCWTEATNKRALSDNTYADDSMTLESCAKFCKGSTYFGVEYGRECYCGNTLNDGSVQAQQSDCSFTCPGDSSEYCGAGNRLELYMYSPDGSSTSNATFGPNTSATSKTTTSATTSAPTSATSSKATTTTTLTTTTLTTTASTTPTPTPTGPARKAIVDTVWKLQGCWTEATNKRALSASTYADDSMTLESCAKFCKGFTYFGVEYGRECYCGNTLNDGSVQAQQSDCSFRCPGDGSEYCGAGNRLELYMYSPDGSSSDATFGPNTSATSKTTSATTSATSSKATTTTSTTTASTTTTTSTTSAPTTTKTTSSSTATTTPSSTSTGTTSSSSASSASSTSQRASSTTTTTTTTSSSTTSVKPTSTGPVISEGNANYTYYNCVSEPSSGRLLSSQIYNNATDMSIEKCLQKCNGYNWVGVEYGQECWCGNKLQLDGGRSATEPGKNVSNSDCNFLCPGNKTEYCGAGVRLSLYVLKDYLKSQSAGPVKLKY